MIRTFANRQLERFYREGKQSGIRPEQRDRLRRVLKALDEADKLSDLKYLRLHQWGRRPAWCPKGASRPWSIDVNHKWRVIFSWDDGHAYDVDFDQPH